MSDVPHPSTDDARVEVCFCGRSEPHQFLTHSWKMSTRAEAAEQALAEAQARIRELEEANGRLVKAHRNIDADWMRARAEAATLREALERARGLLDQAAERLTQSWMYDDEKSALSSEIDRFLALPAPDKIEKEQSER